MSSTSAVRTAALVLGSMLAASVPVSAQSSTPARPTVHYWLTAGAGIGSLTDQTRLLVGQRAAAFAAVGSVQYRAFVASARWARASADLSSVWDVGVLAGVGTSPRPAVRGSIAAGLGRVDGGRNGSGLALPVELQLSWRITPTLGAGVYTFGSFGGPAEFVGATFAVQLGRLR